MFKRWQSILMGLAMLPWVARAHDGHTDSVLHAVLHLLEDGGLFLLLVFLAVLAGLILRQRAHQPKSLGNRHDPR